MIEIKVNNMIDKEFEIPETYEDAVNRKQELLDKINEYNDAFFNNQPLPYTDEEIDAFQEEYQLLNDHLQLTEEEKINRLDEDEKEVLEDGTVVKVESVFDKIHPLTYVYIFLISFLMILFCPLLSNKIGSSMTTSAINKFYEQTFDQTGSGLSMYNDPTLVMSEGKYWFTVVFNFLLIPLIVLIVSTIFFVLSRIFMDKLNKKICLIVYICHIAVFLISLSLIFFLKVMKEAQEYYDYMYYYYYLYIYQSYGISS